jgi:uncharacterized protein RhaS with RHS repeats
VGGAADAGSSDLTKSYGYIGQITVTPPNSKVTVAGSFGSSYLKDSQTGVTAAGGVTAKVENTLISGGLYYQATKSLKVVFEGNYAWSKLHFSGTGAPTPPAKNKTFAPAFGFMLFF